MFTIVKCKCKHWSCTEGTYMYVRVHIASEGGKFFSFNRQFPYNFTYEKLNFEGATPSPTFLGEYKKSYSGIINIKIEVEVGIFYPPPLLWFAFLIIVLACQDCILKKKLPPPTATYVTSNKPLNWLKLTEHFPHAFMIVWYSEYKKKGSGHYALA